MLIVFEHGAVFASRNNHPASAWLGVNPRGSPDAWEGECAPARLPR
jgi:hypothetical protein